ncbi:hypothetical protein EJ03DRAFT_348038 [Teratosphaeria nubilosa]|uniref:Zn(2)-C6 fungal-type domain-containing protein n=1 Tax=Teratosphaeria nubilosa TaxID=161662 RepID=A0A6G1LJ46_9PEZI|nr:hypothetical protein EJ03DRAFT_348038 [Teratosphaeria nubilosa]
MNPAHNPIFSAGANPVTFGIEGPPQQGAHWYPAETNYDFGDEDNGDGHDQDNDHDEHEEGSGPRDAKRRRIARACDMCRKKKIKCDGKMPKCSHCENYKTECIFTHVEKKRAPPKGAKYIEGLENRLGRMESLLRLSGLLAEDDAGRTDLGTLEKKLEERRSAGLASNSASPAQPQVGSVVQQQSTAEPRTPAYQMGATSRNQLHATPPSNGSGGPLTPDAGVSADKEPAKRTAKEVDALADQMCSLITNNYGETRYIGSSSGFSIFSPRGIQWVNEKTGDKSFQQMIASAASDEKQGWDHWKPEVFNDLFERRVFQPLPGKQECFALLKDYFEHFNQMFPLFHEPTFMHLVDKHYSRDPYEGSGWWASLNVALAIGHRLRVMSNFVGQEEDEHAWGYLKNAMAVMTELTIRNTDLLSVQALLGMALFLQGTPNPQPSFFLVAAAIRLAHSLGLHKRGSGFGLNDAENEQRKRVFWIAYMLDKDICLRSGRPPAQDDDDMNVELPSENPPDNVGNVPLTVEQTAADKGGRKTMNLFRLMCLFAQIQSRVYKNLYSVKASRQTDGELLNTIGDLDAELEAWKDSIPADFRPDNEINAAHTPLILHVVVLHFAYYNCLTTIHRMSVHHGYWTSRLSEFAVQGLNSRPLNPRVFMSAALCVNAARTSIGLIRYIPQGDYACVWLILYYPVSALVTLFANILQNPQDARARSDLRLMASVVSFLTMLERDIVEANGNVRRMLSVCAEFERIATIVLSKAEKDRMNNRGVSKRKAVGGQIMTEKERKHMERAMRDRGATEAAIAAALEEGKTLEQMQVETQAAYRRPIQTPSLRQSMARSENGGSQAGGSPASWGAGSPGPAQGQEWKSSPAQQQQSIFLGQQGYEQQMQNLAGQWNNGGAVSGSQRMPDSNTNMNSDHGNTAGQMPMQHQQAPPPQGFTQGMQHDFTNPMTTGFSPPNPALADPLMGGTDMGFGGFDTSPNLGAGGAFQQPFVPQDLWQMPMTLEWDWAEGLGLGSFAPGPMTGFDATGSFMNQNPPGQGPGG